MEAYEDIQPLTPSTQHRVLDRKHSSGHRATENGSETSRGVCLANCLQADVIGR